MTNSSQSALASEAPADLADAYRSRYPHANVALAIADLRGRLALSQAELARRVGTTQSVIARLESGRHGVGIALIDRISDALGLQWRPAFLAPGEDASLELGAPGSLPIVERPEQAGSGDPLLDAFNEANTARDFERARRHALRIAKQPTTPRRKLALSLDAFNRGQFKLALKWAEAAASRDLPIESAEVARIVAARSRLSMGQAHAALGTLFDSDQSPAARAARAEALMDAGRTDEAVALVEQMLGDVDRLSGAGTDFLAARVYWHANRPHRALAAIGAFRAQDPTDVDALLLHGVILGYLADEGASTELYEDALRLFSAAKDDGGPEALRLYAMTAARLGRWEDALPTAHELIQRVAAGEADAKFGNAARQIAVGLFDRIDDVDTLDHAVDAASRLGVVDEATLRSQRAFVRALRGDVDGAAAILGITPPELANVSPDDQVRVASAYVVNGQMTEAVSVLTRNEDVLSNPDGLLILARAALAAKNTTAARRAFMRVADGDDAIAETAALALELVDAIERNQAWNVLDAFSAPVQGSLAYAFRGVEEAQAAPDSFWEGPPRGTGQPIHPTESPVLNRLTADDAATLVIQ